MRLLQRSPGPEAKHCMWLERCLFHCWCACGMQGCSIPQQTDLTFNAQRDLFINSSLL
jgi:hypothetical protein